MTEGDLSTIMYLTITLLFNSFVICSSGFVRELKMGKNSVQLSFLICTAQNKTDFSSMSEHLFYYVQPSKSKMRQKIEEIKRVNVIRY